MHPGLGRACVEKLLIGERAYDQTYVRAVRYSAIGAINFWGDSALRHYHLLDRYTTSQDIDVSTRMRTTAATTRQVSRNAVELPHGCAILSCALFLRYFASALPFVLGPRLVQLLDDWYLPRMHNAEGVGFTSPRWTSWTEDRDRTRAVQLPIEERTERWTTFCFSELANETAPSMKEALGRWRG